jgi:thioredoxin 1
MIKLYLIAIWVILVFTSGTSNGQSAENRGPTGMTKEEFMNKLSVKKIVLVDFYADWCGPCKKQRPVVDEIAKEMKNKVEVIYINTDENKELCRELYINAIPILQVYKKKTLTWTGEGFMPKEMIVKELK